MSPAEPDCPDEVPGRSRRRQAPRGTAARRARDRGTMRSARSRRTLPASRPELLEEIAVNAIVAGHLGMKREAQVRALAHRNRFAVDGGQNFHAVTDLLDPRGANEHAAERKVAEVEKGEIRLEGVHLAAPAVASHRDVER